MLVLILIGMLLSVTPPASQSTRCTLDVYAYGWTGHLADGTRVAAGVESIRLEGPRYSWWFDFSGRSRTVEAEFRGIPVGTFHLRVKYLARYEQGKRHWEHEIVKSRDVRVRPGASSLRRHVVMSGFDVPGY